MEPLILEPLNLPSTKYMDSSDDDDIVVKRSITKPKVFDSDEENSENVSTGRNEKDAESDAEESANFTPNSKKANRKRIQRDLESDSDEGDSNNLSGVNVSLPISNKGDCVETMNSVEKVSDPVSPIAPSTKLSSDSPECKSLLSQSDLYDAEDSEEDIHHPHTLESNEDSPVSVQEPDSTNNAKLKKGKEKKASTKAVKENLQKIHSESQRMVRESRVSLPYHRPRQRTLAEFLRRREHVVLPVTALKASPTKLGAVWKTLEDKVKEAEEFYKSDSDSGLDEEEQSIGLGSDQVAQKQDVGENELKNQEEIPSITSQATIGQEDDPTLLEKSSFPLQNMSEPNVEGVEFETVKMLPSKESPNEGTDCPTTPGICAQNDEEPDVPCGNEISVSNAFTASAEVCDVTSDLQETSLDEETGLMTEENDLNVNGENCAHKTEDVDGIPSIMNDILDAVTKDESSSKSDVCQDSHSKNIAQSATSSSDFSNLFPKSIIAGSDEASKIGDLSNISSDVHCEDPPRTSDNMMDTHENSSLHQIKIPPPPPLEDSDSISLRLDDDTVDESGPNPDRSHVPSQSELPEDVANSVPQVQDEVEETPRVSTPVRMLKELEENMKKASADISEADILDDHSKALPTATGVHLAITKPIQLEGDLDNIIDLDEDVRSYPTKEVGVRDLMARFIKHHIPKKVVCEEKKVDIGIEVFEAGGDKGPDKVKREVMTVTLGGGDPIKNASPGTERPGARLRSLREELQREIARKRDEEWAKRQQEYALDEEEVGEGGGKCDLDNEEEEELTDSSSSEEEEDEEELEENDVDMSTKSRPKSAYLDDEAEESDEEGDDVDGGNVEDIDDDNEEDVDGDNEEDDVDGDNKEDDVDGGSEEEDVNEGNEEKDVVGGNEGSSLGDKEDEEEEALILENGSENKLNETKMSIDIKDTSTKDEGAGQVDSPALSQKRRFQRFKTVDLFDSEDDEANDYNSAADLTSPPSTPFAYNRNEARRTLPSPALPLTALQRYTNSPSTIGNSSPWAFTQKTLFDDEESPKHTKDEKDSLKGKSALLNLVGQSQGSEMAEDELLNLMSGAFLSRANKMSETEDDFSLNLEDTQELFDKSQAKEKVKEEDDGDEKSCQKSLQNFADSNWNKLSFTFNDEDKDGDKEASLDGELDATMKRKKLKRLNISDDEDEASNLEKPKFLGDKEDDADESDAQVSDAKSEVESGEEEEESDLDEDDGGERVVEYDSEENAIVVEKRAVKKTRGPRRGLEYLEAEAELSEGEEEWAGSGDEDEHGLDRMEKEEGDADKLDDEIVRRELGRIHMRQVLDEDKREVRLLQEIFLEDGELHAEGQGRERKFRWRNIDNMDDGDFRPLNSDDEEKVDEEDENEEKWRRLRHERETWLREHQQNGKSQDAESLFNDVEEDSQLLKLGRAALRRINSFPNNSLTRWLKPTVEPKDKNNEATKPPDKEPESPDVKRPFQMLCRRGSFLARKDGTLERLAEIAMKTGGGAAPECLTSTSPVVAKTKNSHKFVFTVLSPEKKDPKTSMEAPKEVSLPARKSIKRKKGEPKGTEGIMKKSKPCKEASIFQFL